MTDSTIDPWKHFLTYYTEYPSLGLGLDLSHVHWPSDFFETMGQNVAQGFTAMKALEAGEIANPDEDRMVGHYWLRAPELAPTSEITTAIRSTVERIKAFASKVHSSAIQGQGGPFKHVIVIGIGGSALGPLFVSNALGNPASDKMAFHILNNTDSDGIDHILAKIGSNLNQSICIVISKSGGTKETRNGMLETKWAYERAGLDFSKHAVAITQEGSALDKRAIEEGWIDRFPMWDWVGGRTSELSAVGLLPGALQGFDIDNLLDGARKMDGITRLPSIKTNPAMRMALAWHAAGNGNGEKNLVILPYKDRLELLSKYLQQLIMESVGKEKSLTGQIVHQGLSVFGNKGSTDQHSFVQQLRDGRNDFLVTFIEVLKDREGLSLDVEPDLTSGDFLQGMLLGTQSALSANKRQSLTLTIREVNAESIGALIALFERTVGFYASLIGVNAYHQPGVEAGKAAAGEIVALKVEIQKFLAKESSQHFSAQAIVNSIHTNISTEYVYKICKRLSANKSAGVIEITGQSPETTRFGVS